MHDWNKRSLIHIANTEQRICFKEVRLQPKRQASETMGGPEEGDEFMVVEPNPSASTEKIDRLTGKTVASTRAGRGGKKSGKVKGKKRQRDGNEEEEGYEEGREKKTVRRSSRSKGKEKEKEIVD
ncbi:hypothetical protein BDQ17DRAFT_1318381 [Cyathus striatus]|nr:hypothetical protein BDQ17DRAFT_1318381 [Cyathus striatus]